LLERFRRTTHSVFALCAVLVAIVAGAGGVARAESAHELDHQLSDAKSRAEAARAEEQALAADIAAQSDAIDGVEAELASVGDELATLEARLSRSRARLNALSVLQRQKARQLVRARRMLGTAQRRLNDRIVDIYTSDQPDTVAVLLGAESLDEVLDRLETQSRVVAYDADLVGQVTELRARVARERRRAARLKAEQARRTATITRDTNARRAAYSSLVARRDSLASLRSTRQRSLASVQVERSRWEAQADALAAESAQLASIAAAPPSAPAAPSSPTPASSSSGFVWPVGGSLVSPFGQRWGRLHSGIDIAAPAGTPVVASAAGTVAYAGSMSGYGLIVVIQHAGGIATAYAHNSSIAVSVGQAVAQSQTIAAVGCTGHCFGDHVHFEVRVGGSPVDPMGYL
jgi:murein DD-endopeptidase MepM/ murein hydrolase activator NlpD